MVMKILFSSSTRTMMIVAATLAAIWSPSAMAYIVVPESTDAYTSAYALGGFNLSADAQIENSTTIPHTSVTANNNHASVIDWFSFGALAGSTIHLDIDTDNWGGLFDSTLALWDSSGALMAQNDDFAGDPGSTTAGVYFWNSQIYSTALVTGT